jgi:hypothetical protein
MARVSIGDAEAAEIHRFILEVLEQLAPLARKTGDNLLFVAIETATAAGRYSELSEKLNTPPKS